MDSQESSIRLSAPIDPRQEHIYRRLLLVGEGPAAFYRDACRLLEAVPPFETTTHLIGHLLREIESALRAVLRPVSDRMISAIPNQTKKQEGQASKTVGHETNIRAILQGLEIPETDPVAILWLRLPGEDNPYGLHRRAHRDNLAGPRPFDESFRTFWHDINTVLDGILDKFEAHFLESHQFIDEKFFAAVSSMDEKMKLLRNNVPNNIVSLGYFFEKLGKEQNIDWLPYLREDGYFQHPPEPVPGEEKNTLTFQVWPASRYLVQVAPHAPKEVLQLIRETIPATQNFLVYEDLLDASCQMPPSLAKGMVHKAKQGLALAVQGSLPQKVGKLIAHLAQGGEPDAALELLGALIAELPKLSAYYDCWRYQQTLKEQVPLVVKVVGLEALLVFCHWLEAHLQGSSSESLPMQHDSSLWRPAIEDHEQNHPEEWWEVPDILISLVRDTATQVIAGQQSPVEEVVSLLEGYAGAIFRRINVYLLSLFPEAAPHVVATYLTNQQCFDALECRHEYMLLAQAGFAQLAPDEQERILSWIARGPMSVESSNRTNEQPEEQSSPDDLSSRKVKRWQRDWLACLSPMLPPEWQLRYEQLVAEFGAAEHPDTPSFGQVHIWEGPPVPEFALNLPAKSVTEIVAFLLDQSWQRLSAEGWNSPFSPAEGIRQQLLAAVVADPPRFAKEAGQFRQVHPRYLSGILSGFEHALLQKVAFLWSPVLDLCLWVLAASEQQEERSGEAEEHRPWLRTCCKTIANLLLQGLESNTQIPLDLHQKLWEVIEKLTTDPDPTPAREAPFRGSVGELTGLALNTIRGEALHATILYAWWWQRHPEQHDEEQERRVHGLDALPQVRRVLEQHLDPSFDASLAIRSIYGRRFYWLAQLDRGWTAVHLSSIFPAEESLQDFWRVAWGAFIVYSRPSPLALELLQELYRRALERLAPTERTPDPRAHSDYHLGRHMLVAYTEGYLTFDEPASLLALFFACAPDAVRGQALGDIGKWLYRTSLARREINAQQRERLQTLWERRLEAAKTARPSGNYTQELAAFGWWFGSKGFFERAWALAQVEQTLQLLRERGSIEAAFHVVERLAEASEALPLEAVKCLALMERDGQVGWDVPGEYEHMRTILLHARQAGDEAWAIGCALINRLEAHGTTGFKELL